MVSDHKELHMMMISSRYLPKKSESKPNGEDAHIFSATQGIIIVCDGVGGSARRGINSGVYAAKLVLNTAAALEKQPKHAVVNPKEALLEAHASTSAKGSSTACVIALAGGNKLRFANVGDSGFLVFRGWRRLVYQSPKRQHYLNCPYQLAEWKSKSDVSRLVDEGEVEVEAGDVVVAGTDGLFDNVSVSEIASILRETAGRGLSEKLARKIASRALSNSKNKNYESPFQREAWRAGEVRPGGKYDDITVVVAEIGVRAARHRGAASEEVGAEMESVEMKKHKGAGTGQMSWANVVKMS